MRVMAKPVPFVVAAMVVVVALWLFFKPQRPELQAQDSAKAAAAASATGAAAGTPGQAAPTASARDDVFELTIRGGKLASGPALIKVYAGDRVTLNIKSDSSDELHLHGYDLHAQIRPGQTQSLQFTADRTGRFGMELHKAHTELGALEVYPQ
jgi:plastocyanin